MARFIGAVFGTVRVVRERRSVCYCMLALDEKSTFFRGVGGISWGGLREWKWEADRSSFGTLPTLLVTKPWSVTL